MNRPLMLRIASADDMRNVLGRVIARRVIAGKPVGPDLREQFARYDRQH